MAKLNINPISASYTFAEPAQTLHQSLPGGMPRQRAGLIGDMSRLVSVTFVCNQIEYDYIVQFVRQNIANDCPLIEIDLLISEAVLIEHTALIVPDTFALDSIDAITFTCSMQLQVMPLGTEVTTWPAVWDAGVLELQPDKSSYTVKYGNESIAVQYDGNVPNQRRTFFNASRLVSLRWHCVPANFDRLLQAYRAWRVSGGDLFFMDLFMDKSILTRHRCTFVPGTFRLSSHQGDLHIIEADLEVESTPWLITFTSHGDGGIGGGGAGDIPSGEAPAGAEIAWFEPISGSSGTLDHLNSGSGVCDDFAPSVVTTIFAGLVGWTSEVISWSISWSSGSGHSSPTITDQADDWVQISWSNLDGSPGFISDASIGTLILTATVDSVPIAIGERLIAVTSTTADPDYPNIAWGPE